MRIDKHVKNKRWSSRESRGEIMNKREVLIILNKLKDVSESNDITRMLTLTHLECINLLKYMIELKSIHDKDRELVDNISTMIKKRNSEV